MWVGTHPTQEQIERAKKELGLDQPLHMQFLIYMNKLLHGDLGVSIRTHRPVLQDILSFIPASLELVGTGIIIAVVIGIPLGVVSATRKDSWIDHLSRLFSIGGVSIFTPWLGMMGQLLFFKWLGVLPVGDRVSTSISIQYPIQRITGFYLIDSLITGNFVAFQDVLSHLMLPAFVVAAYPIGLVARMIRSTMTEVLEEDYIKTAKAYGIPKRTIAYRYALKNSLGPTITVLALSFAYSLVETFLIEMVFNWPGLGRYAAFSIISLDYPAIMGVAIFIALIYIFLNLIVDILQAFIDPRIRLT
jgi:peptide/nickel transport system permease protein